MRQTSKDKKSRRGAIAVLAAVLMVIVVGMAALAIDYGYIAMTRAQAQVAADAGALAAAAFAVIDGDQAVASAKQFAGHNQIGARSVRADSVGVEFGSWDPDLRRFQPSPTPGNAVRVSVARDAQHDGEVPLFFARALGKESFRAAASAVAVVNPRDIALVIDLSGSMNNDTEPCWATNEINATFGPQGYPAIGEELMADVFADFGYGPFPGTLQWVGAPLGVGADQYAYAELTKNSGPLTGDAIAAAYKISSTDSEATRKQKAYKWIIDNQIAAVMPAAQPTPNSSVSSSYSYWERYLDYIMQSQSISSTSPKGRPRPSTPVTLPPSQWSKRMDGMGNPYTDCFPSASVAVPRSYRNQIGYRTYVQFMMDMGREYAPVTGQYVPLSINSPHCPRRSEATAGGTFSFPPREQPTHAVRRALIAALQLIKERNAQVSDPNQRDWVSVVQFDMIAGTSVRQPLTYNYDAAMAACVDLQAVSDTASSTATETGLIAAKNHIAGPSQGGQGRQNATKIVVYLTDGVPNLYSSSSTTISSYIAAHPSSEFYSSSENAYNAVLMQSAMMQSGRWRVYPVGVGLGCDYDFMDRSARLGGTADKDGFGSRGSGNPAVYEQRLREIFEQIISNPRARLVQ